MWYNSIKVQILVVLMMQILVLLGIVITSLYLIKLRQHDYLILNLTGQLRVITQSLVTQSRHYVDAAPRDYATYNRDLNLYNRDLQQEVASFNKIVQALKQRTIEADLLSNRILMAGSFSWPFKCSCSASAARRARCSRPTIHKTTRPSSTP